MKQTLFISLMFFTSFVFSQNVEAENDFRQLKGKVLDETGIPFPGQNIMIKGTEIGTQTDLDGNFCLVIPKNKTVYIEFPFCFEQITKEIKPTDNYVEAKIGKEKRKSKKANQKWIKNKDVSIAELNKIYNFISYEQIKNVICR